jgi:hypothetical protein
VSIFTLPDSSQSGILWVTHNMTEGHVPTKKRTIVNQTLDPRELQDSSMKRSRCARTRGHSKMDTCEA